MEDNTTQNTHFVPKEGFSNPVSIINKIAYQQGNVQFAPIEDLTLDRVLENLKMKTDVKERAERFLRSKKEDENLIKDYLLKHLKQ